MPSRYRCAARGIRFPTHQITITIISIPKNHFLKHNFDNSNSKVITALNLIFHTVSLLSQRHVQHILQNNILSK